MTTSIAETRQNLPSLIDAAQSTPQIITKRNKPVAVLVSVDFFNRTERLNNASPVSFFQELLQLRKVFAPTDNLGLIGAKISVRRQGAWTRANEFVEAESIGSNMDQSK
jgi:prevent-host-death family protein